MNGYRAALAVELLKARRTKTPLVTLLAMTAAGAIPGLFMFVLADPSRARRLGLLQQKAQLSGLTPDWAGLLGFLAQIVAVGGLLIYAFVLVWVFGQELTAGTLRYLLALPISRSAIVLAKFTVAYGWCTALTLWLTGVVTAIGAALGLPGGSGTVLAAGFAHTAAAGVLMLLAATPAALTVCVFRSQPAALAATAAALVTAQIAAALGLAAVVPWSVPAVAAGLVPDTRLDVLAVALTLATALAGLLGTQSWWRSSHAGSS